MDYSEEGEEEEDWDRYLVAEEEGDLDRCSVEEEEDEEEVVVDWDYSEVR